MRNFSWLGFLEMGFVLTGAGAVFLATSSASRAEPRNLNCPACQQEALERNLEAIVPQVSRNKGQGNLVADLTQVAAHLSEPPKLYAPGRQGPSSFPPQEQFRVAVDPAFNLDFAGAFRADAVADNLPSPIPFPGWYSSYLKSLPGAFAQMDPTFRASFWNEQDGFFGRTLPYVPYAPVTSPSSLSSSEWWNLAGGSYASRISPPPVPIRATIAHVAIPSTAVITPNTAVITEMPRPSHAVLSGVPEQTNPPKRRRRFISASGIEWEQDDSGKWVAIREPQKLRH